MLAAADRAGTAKSAGFTGTDAWTAKHTNTSRTTAAREVHLATELETGHGHESTAAALDAGLVSPAHAAVILHATDQLPTGVTTEQRETVEAALVEKAQRFNPDQLRRLAKRALETIEPDQTVVDAHENELVRTDEQAALEKCSLTFHDHADGTTTGHFTIPTLAAAILRKIIESMTAPRRMRTDERHHPDWRHRRGLAFVELLEHLPTDHLHPTAATRGHPRDSGNDQEERSGGCRLDTVQRPSPPTARPTDPTPGHPRHPGSKPSLSLGRSNRLLPNVSTCGRRHGTNRTSSASLARSESTLSARCRLHHRNPGVAADPPTSTTPSRCATTTTNASTTTPTSPPPEPDGAIRFSRRC